MMIVQKIVAALTGVAQWAGIRPTDKCRWLNSQLVYTPESQARSLAGAHVRDARWMFLSRIDVSLPLSHPP